MPVTRGLYTEAKNIFQNTFLSGDIDEDKIIPYIVRAQELYLFDKIGQRLYEHIDGLIHAETITDAANAAYNTLAVQYLAPCVDYWAASEYLRYGGYTASDNGIYRKQADNATVATQSEIQKLIGALESAAENKWSVAWDFLCQNTGDYPEYFTTEAQQRPPSQVVYKKPFL